MRIAISGSSGLVGSALVFRLEQAGHVVQCLVRGIPEDDEIGWDLANGEIEHEKLEGVDAVVHLAGESIADGRWTAAKKARILASRVDGTQLLARTLARLNHKPRVLVSASAIGYYGDRGEEVCTEQSPAGTGFLPDVCTAWEEATQPASESGIRVVKLRIGIVLSRHGGALSKMLLPFRLGVGGIVGSGRQFWSWISLHDLVRALVHAIECESLQGAVNGVAPQAVTNREFTKSLGRVLNRPTIFPMPAFAARLALGQMADDLLLSSAHVVPNALRDSGFQFEQPELEPALRAICDGRE